MYFVVNFLCPYLFFFGLSFFCHQAPVCLGPMLQRVLDCLEVRKLAPHYLGKLLQPIQQTLEVKLTNYLIFKMQVLHDSICISILSLFQGMHFCLCTLMTGVNPQRSLKVQACACWKILQLICVT